MKINQLLVEARLDEKPMGLLKTAGNKIMSKFGSGKATGRLKTGDLANKMHQEYEVYLGQTGEEPSAENLLAFLKFKKYPTQNVATYLSSPEAQDQAPEGPGEAPAAPAKSAAPAADAAQEPVEPTMDPEAPAEEPAAQAEPTAPGEEPAEPAAQAAPNFSNQLAGGKQSISAGGKFDPATMKNTPGAAVPTGAIPNPQAAPAMTGNMPPEDGEEPAAPNPAGYNAKTGAAIPGDAAANKAKQDARSAARMSNPATAKFNTDTGEPIDLKTQIKNRMGQQDTNFAKYKAAANAKGIQNASRSFAGKRSIAEAVSDKVVDKAILIAAQDAAKMGIGQALGGAPAAGAPEGPAGGAAAGGGFMAGLQKGMGGAAAAKSTVNYDQVKAMVDKLDPQSKTQLLTDLKAELGESTQRKGAKLAESKQYYSIFRKV